MAQLGRLWIAASVALVLPAVASAQDITITAKKMPNGYEPVTQVVHLADLNLTTSTGVDEMQKRVTSAVNVRPRRTGRRPKVERISDLQQVRLGECEAADGQCRGKRDAEAAAAVIRGSDKLRS